MKRLKPTCKWITFSICGLLNWLRTMLNNYDSTVNKSARPRPWDLDFINTHMLLHCFQLVSSATCCLLHLGLCCSMSQSLRSTSACANKPERFYSRRQRICVLFLVLLNKVLVCAMLKVTQRCQQLVMQQKSSCSYSSESF